jgi:hypothetical protein
MSLLLWMKEAAKERLRSTGRTHGAWFLPVRLLVLFARFCLLAVVVARS